MDMTRGAVATEPEQKRGPGRPREFDRDAVLHAAMLVFWRHGYEGASLAELTEAMGISKPTLYAAFGDKAGLFREAVLAYTNLSAREYAAALKLPTVREVAEAWLRLTAGVRRDPETPSGCLITQAALVGSAETEALRDELMTMRNEGTVLLMERFRRAEREGDLPPGTDADTFAQFFASLATGFTVQSAGGVSPEELHRVIDMVMAKWPW